MARDILTANRNYFVRPDGSDSNTGLVNNAGGAFRNIQPAFDLIQKCLDTAGYTVTVICADGDYMQGATLKGSVLGCGDIYLQGNPSTPANCRLTVAGGNCVSAARGARVFVHGFRFKTTGSGHALHVEDNALLQYQSVEFDQCAGMHLDVGAHSTICAGGAYKIIGGALGHYHAPAYGLILGGSFTVQVENNPLFSAYFAGAGVLGAMSLRNVVFTGSARGPRFLAHKGGMIDVGDGDAHRFPGDSEGRCDLGGGYISTSLPWRIATANLPGDQVVLSAFDTGAGAYVDFGALTAGDPPTASWITA